LVKVRNEVVLELSRMYEVDEDNNSVKDIVSFCKFLNRRNKKNKKWKPITFVEIWQRITYENGMDEERRLTKLILKKPAGKP
jgi:hypothetical protein